MSAGEEGLGVLRTLASNAVGIGIVAVTVTAVGLGIAYAVRISRPERAPQAVRAEPQVKKSAPVPLVTAQSVRFDQLARSESAHDRLEAYKLAQRCMLEAQLADLPGVDYAKTCDLPRDRWSDRELRRKLIEPAALEGLPGAWRALYEEGPKGRFKSMADHGWFRDLEARAYTAALARADRFALSHEADIQEASGNLARALTLTVASAASLAKQQKRQGSYDPDLDPHLDLTHFRSRLEPDIAQAAITEGLKLVAEAL